MVLILIALMNTHFFINAWRLLTENGYFIPQESSIFRFDATEMNEGSGGWWLYGEDDKYYYGIPQNGICDYYYDSDFYFKLQKGDEPENFDRLDCNTWQIENNQDLTSAITPVLVDYKSDTYRISLGEDYRISCKIID